MNRAFLCSAIEGLASKCGYHFQLGDESHYPTILCRYPAAFMSQPQFISLEGRKKGKITYSVSLRLARQAAKLPLGERSDILHEMENTLMDIFVELSTNRHIAVVEDLTITPNSDSIDAHGAISVEAKANVITIF